jgi:dTDP-4-dehydrorhamnose 3,5-epimerase
MLDGVILTKLKEIKDKRGSVFHMLRNDSKVFKSFGEIYFSTIFPKTIKAWHMHKEMILNYACIEGEIKLVLFDSRKNSSTKNQTQEIILSRKNYFLVTVPPLIWNGFVNIGKKDAILANCSNVPYSDEEIIRKSSLDKSIPYKW